MHFFEIDNSLGNRRRRAGVGRSDGSRFRAPTTVPRPHVTNNCPCRLSPYSCTAPPFRSSSRAVRLLPRRCSPMAPCCRLAHTAISTAIDHTASRSYLRFIITRHAGASQHIGCVMRGTRARGFEGAASARSLAPPRPPSSRKDVNRTSKREPSPGS